MKLLLDTHVLIWMVATPERVAPPAVKAVENGANEVFVSVVSAWEIAIKESNGKLRLKEPAEAWLPEHISRAGFQSAVPSMSAAFRVSGLPFHHKDPFDRLLIAQALEEGYTIVTRDRWFAAYGVGVLQA